MNSTYDAPADNSTRNSLQLLLATGAFAVCFAIFGSVSAMMPILKKQMHLSPLQVSVAIALPVLLGSLGRIPLGILTDRHGGRKMFSIVMAGSIIPVIGMSFVHTYVQLLVAAFGCGLALASFSVGAGFVSSWFPPQRQGFALGVYGAGNVGQSLAAFGAPMLAKKFGFAWGFWTFAALTLAWLALYLLMARDAPNRPAPKSLQEVLLPLSDRLSWVLSMYYFLTFGGFVAMALLMALPQMVPFTFGALGMAAAIGAGNGAVFKLVPEYFPRAVGSVTGLVGAAGGLGGFFPPLLLGVVRQSTGGFAPGFFALAVCALGCWAVCRAAKPAPVMPAVLA